MVGELNRVCVCGRRAKQGVCGRRAKQGVCVVGELNRVWVW